MNVHHFLSSSTDRFPEKIAVNCHDRQVSYAELDLLSNRMARALTDAGVKPGDRVVVLVDNCVEAAISLFGILKAGAAFVFIGQTVKADKLRFILSDCEARAAITQSYSYRILSEVEGQVDSLKAVFLFGADPGGDPPSATPHILDPTLSNHPSSRPDDTTIDQDLAALIYTSGSTGFPKGVAVSHHNVVSAATSITQYLENVPEDRIISVLPLSFDYGLYQLLMSVKVGATLILEKSFAYPYKVVERIAEENVTGFPGVPTIFAVLLRMKSINPNVFDSVRYLSNTAAALPPAHIRRLGDMFRNARIFSMYGLTECKRVSYLPPEDLEMRPTSVGKGMPNEEIFVVDEDGLPVPPGTVGELVVRGSNVMLGYWNRPEETADIIRPGRYPWERLLYTGDLFTMDEDGFFYFVSRKDDIIKTRGEKVSPAEVERIIHELDAVQEAAVVGVSDPILGEAIKAFVVPVASGALSKKDVTSHCSRRLEVFMVPKEIEFCDSLPTTSTGKISRKMLRESVPAENGGV